MDTRDTGRAALKALGLKQVDIALRMGVTQQAVSDWLTGRAVPSAENRVKIHGRLGIPADLWDADDAARAATPGHTPDSPAAEGA